MINTVTRLEHKVGDKVYHFICEMNSPIGEVFDALCAFKGMAVEIMRQQHENEKAQLEAAKASQEPKPE